MLKYTIDKTLPEKEILIAEEISEDGQRYIATLTAGSKSMQVFADTYSDWLPDDFFQQFEQIPVTFESSKLYCSINPAIGLTGQDAWYFAASKMI